jgi:hypothetical protein
MCGDSESPPPTTTEDIITALSELGHQVTHVHNKHSFDKSPLPLFFVDLKKATNNIDLYKIEYLLHTKIVVEKPHPLKGPLQCHPVTVLEFARPWAKLMLVLIIYINKIF